MMDFKQTTPCLSLVLLTAACLFQRSFGYYFPSNMSCSPDSSSACPLNINNEHRCRLQSRENLGGLLEHHDSDVSDLLCHPRLMVHAPTVPDVFSIPIIRPVYTAIDCNSATLELQFRRFDESVIRGVRIAALDKGKIISSRREERFEDVTLTYVCSIGDGRSFTVNIMYYDNKTMRAVQCSYPNTPECLDAELYQKCGSREITPEPTILPLAYSTETTATTTTTTTTTTYNATRFAPPTSAMTSRRRPVSSVKPSPDPNKPSKGKTGNTAVLWQTLFMFVGILAGALTSAIIIVIIVKYRSRRRRQHKTHRHKDNTFNLKQKSECMHTPEIKDYGYEVPRTKPSGLRESIYDIIKDEDVKL